MNEWIDVSEMGERTWLHPTFGVGTIISVNTNEDGRRIATCRFNDPPGKERGSHGVIPTAQIVLEADDHG